MITLFNPSPYKRIEILNITITSPFVKVYDHSGILMKKSQVSNIYVQKGQKLIESKKYALYFEASIEAFGHAKYFYQMYSTDQDCKDEVYPCAEISEVEDFTQLSATTICELENDVVKVRIRPKMLLS